MESLKENMGHITEALKERDILLAEAKRAGARARGKEQLLQEPSPPPQTYEDEIFYEDEGAYKDEGAYEDEGVYEDEDVYMADNETQNRLRKSIQKGKGKARQVETEDEEMENSEKSEEENGEMDDDEDAPEAERVLNHSKGSSTVPRPYKFSKPKGGAGPKLRAQPSRILPDDPSESESDNPPQPLNTLPNPLNLSHDALAALTNTVLGVIGQRDDLLASRMRRRRIASQKIKQPTIRASNTRRKELGVSNLLIKKKLPMADE